MTRGDFLNLLEESEIYVRAFKTQSIPPKTIEDASILLKKISKYRDNLIELQKLAEERNIKEVRPDVLTDWGMMEIEATLIKKGMIPKKTHPFSV